MQHIAVVTGGDSGERVISLKSADMVLQHLDQSVFQPWKVVVTGSDWVVETPTGAVPVNKNDFSFHADGQHIRFEGVFMVIHGTPGEDGKLQGYFDVMGIPYTCCNLTTSALTFNKGWTTTLAGQMGIRVARSAVSTVEKTLTPEQILEQVDLPCFVKPNKGGSSIGISRVDTADQLPRALENAFAQDDEVIIEDFIAGTEVTCGVANVDGNPRALAVTEIVFHSEFFDFHAKYEDKATEEITPARIPDDQYNRIMQMSERIFDVLNCKGIIRIDYIIRDGEPFMIEVNTIPGLTRESLIPKQAEYNGISKTELFTKLMQYTLERAKLRKQVTAD